MQRTLQGKPQTQIRKSLRGEKENEKEKKSRRERKNQRNREDREAEIFAATAAQMTKTTTQTTATFMATPIARTKEEKRFHMQLTPIIYIEIIFIGTK